MRQVPIRFIRGCPDTEAVYGKVFIYDGLYDVIEHTTAPGKSGFDVITFRLRRRPGQPPLTSTTVEFGHGSIPKSFAAIRRPGLVDDDISGGLERIPVVAVNDVDKELPPCTRPRKVLVRASEPPGPRFSPQGGGRETREGGRRFPPRMENTPRLGSWGE